jgi:hypothetical protein
MSGVGPAGRVYYRPAEVARLLHCSEWWVKEQARRRRIPFCWIGGSYLFTEEHIAAIVRLFEVQPTGEPSSAGDCGAVGSSARPRRRQQGAPVLLKARTPRRIRDATGGQPAA